MSLERNSENRLIIKQENDVIEISPLKINGDVGESFSVDHLISLVLPEKTSDILSKITALELPRCNLTDLPEVCKELRNLKRLNLSCNNLTNIPSCLYTGLKLLESLDLSWNQIEHFDMELECMPFVKVILLNNNKFENIPKWFLTFRCTNLEEFSYSHNKAKHYKYLKNSFNLNLIKLNRLELKNSCLIDSDYNFLKCFKTLRYLDISNEADKCCNKFYELDELFVKPKWKELHILRLKSLSISLFPDGIVWIETLRELYLTDNAISWLPDDIQYLVNLEVLDISHNCIIAIPNAIASLESLTALHASDNSIERGFDFSLLPNLKILDLYNNLLDTVAFDIDAIHFVDVEDNYYDTKYFEKYPLYEEKKNRLRNKYSYQRSDGFKKLRENSSISSRDTDEEIALINTNTDFGCINSNLILIDYTENWDSPIRVRSRNSEIDSIDEEWQGGDSNFCIKDYSKKNRTYVSDEDWMFIDIEES